MGFLLAIGKPRRAQRLSQVECPLAAREREFAGTCGEPGAEHSSDKKQIMLKYNSEFT